MTYDNTDERGEDAVARQRGGSEPPQHVDTCRVYNCYGCEEIVDEPGHLPECPRRISDTQFCICDRLRSLEARILSKVDASGDCWLWTGVIDRYGYGQIKRSGKNYKAHRMVYEALVGPIPDGMELDHLCKVRNCVRPDHCEPVDHRTNTLRGQTVTAANAAKTHCDEGHPFDEDNTYERKRGGRVCRKCHAERERERYHARREAR